MRYSLIGYRYIALARPCWQAWTPVTQESEAVLHPALMEPPTLRPSTLKSTMLAVTNYSASSSVQVQRSLTVDFQVVSDSRRPGPNSFPPPPTRQEPYVAPSSHLADFLRL